MTPYIYLVYYGYEKTVIDSQVVVPLIKLKQAGLKIQPILFETGSTLLNYLIFPKKRHRLKPMSEFSPVYLPRIPRNLFWLNSFVLWLVLLPVYWRNKSLFVHARGLQGSDILIPLKRLFKRLTIICDVRGLESEEYSYAIQKKRGGKLNFFQRQWRANLEKIQGRALRGSNRIVCVSQAMMGYLKQKYPMIPNNKWAHIPCAVDIARFDQTYKSREALREKLGLKNKLVVVYAGSLSPWQLPDRIADIFGQIYNQNDTAHLLGLTPDVTILTDHLKKKGIPLGKYTIRKVPYDDIPRYLVCGDVGLLIRENHPLNRYACPTKFAEYLSGGLYIVSTRSIDDVTSVVEKYSAGTVLSTIDDPEKLKLDIKFALDVIKKQSVSQANRIEIARQLYSWDTYVPHLKKWYLELNSMNEGGRNGF